MRVLFLFFAEPPRPFSTSVAALSAAVREAGHEPSCLSIRVDATIADVVAEVERARPDVIGASLMTRDWPGACTLLPRVAERTGAFVVAGGYHATLAPREVAACDGVSAIGIGEGERALPVLLDRLSRGEGAGASFPGMWVRGEHGFEGAPPAAAPEPDIAALPRWDYEVFGDVGAILAHGINTFGPHQDRFLPVRASRGCPFTCAYCSAPRWNAVAGIGVGRPTRDVRPVEHLCDELAALRDRWAPEGFEFWDEHFPIDLGWLRELAREHPRRVGLPFKVEMHPSAATRPRLEALAEAGCVLFHIGVEAGDPELRRRVLDRRASDEVVARVIADAHELGMATSASVMTALPGETEAQAERTVELLRKLRPGSMMWSSYQALPGTKLGDALSRAPVEPARVRLDDTRAQEPGRAMSEDAQRRVHASLERVRAELAAASVPVSSLGRRPRAVAVPVVPVPASPALCALVGEDAARVRSVEWQGETLVLAVEIDGAPPAVVRIAGRGEAPAYVSSEHLGVAYEGATAPPALLAAVERIAARLGATTLGELRRASRG